RPPPFATRSAASSERSGAERGERTAGELRGEQFLRLQVRHEEPAAAVVEAEVVDGQHAQRQRHLRANRIQVRIEELLGDLQRVEPHGHDAASAPYEK